MLDRIQAARHVGFLPTVFDQWIAAGLLPAPSVDGQFWTAAELDTALNRLETEGHQSSILAHSRRQYHALPNVHRTFVITVAGFRSYHHKRRGLRGPIYCASGSPRFMKELIQKERKWAEKQMLSCDDDLNKPSASPLAPAQDHLTPNHFNVQTKQQGKLPNLTSDALLHIGGVVPSDQQLPLYPSELEIGQAVLGTERAHEWPAVAEALEREGLPLADPLTGARFWPLVQAYFAARHGLDGGLTVHKHAPLPKQPTKITLHAPKVVTQKESIESTQVMPTRRRSAIIQADIARTIRAAKQAGAARVEVRLSDSSTAIVRLGPDGLLEFDEDIIL
ncbi:MAG: hypothetical protein WBF58_03075 [Xanthobacteraceae bacterium]